MQHYQHYLFFCWPQSSLVLPRLEALSALAILLYAIYTDVFPQVCSTTSTSFSCVQEIALNIEPQEYLCRTVVTIIPVSQLSSYQEPEPAHQPPHQTAQQVRSACRLYTVLLQHSAAASSIMIAQQGLRECIPCCHLTV